MFKVTVEATTPKQRENLHLFLKSLAYHIEDEMCMQVMPNSIYKGYSGGDDAYFALQGKTVEVRIK